MNPIRLNLVLAAVLALVLTAGVFLRPDATQPNWEFFPEMKHSPAVHAFEVSEHFANGRTQQAAVRGTIPRGRRPLHFDATKDEAVRAGEVLKNPYHEPAAATAPESPPAAESPSDPTPAASAAPSDRQVRLAASLERGAAIYHVYCQCCHGAKGAGDGPVAQRGFPPPPPLPTGKSVQMQDGQLFHILTYGQGSMSSMAAQLDREQRWDVINFVRTLQQSAATAAAAAPAPAIPAAPPESAAPALPPSPPSPPVQP